MRIIQYQPNINYDLSNLEAVFGSRSEVANILGVDKSQLTRWRKQTHPDRLNMSKIFGINFVISRLMENFRYPESAMKWLNGVNMHINNQRPVDLLRQNKIKEVLSAIDMYETGAYA